MLSALVFCFQVCELLKPKLLYFFSYFVTLSTSGSSHFLALLILLIRDFVVLLSVRILTRFTYKYNSNGIYDLNSQKAALILKRWCYIFKIKASSPLWDFFNLQHSSLIHQDLFLWLNLILIGEYSERILKYYFIAMNVLLQPLLAVVKFWNHNSISYFLYLQESNFQFYSSP